MRLIFTVLWVGLLCFQRIYAQNNAKYLVLLKDKANSPFSISNPKAFLSERSIARRLRQQISITTRDLPVSPSYISQIRQTGSKVWFTSRWLNAVLVEATPSQLHAVRQLSFVKGIEFNRPLANARLSAENQVQERHHKFGTEALEYGASLNQIQMLGIDKMHEQGHTGKGVWVAILDGGFRNSNTNIALKTLFDEKRVIGTYDFVRNETSVYEDDAHGNNVLSIMASLRPNALIGSAFGASYLLLRTEDAATETRLEEANWLFAAEYADSVGVDIINSSLGYYNFDNPADDYKYADMNGRTTLVTRAAAWAAAAGIVVVVSAGNEGNVAWRYITAPADADSILAVGAVNGAQIRTAFSSIGPTADGRVKPDLCAQGQATVLSNQFGNTTIGNGTSYSSPLIAGLAAGFWEAFPQLSAMQVIDCLRKAGDRFNAPTPEYGFGIPTFERAADIARRDYDYLFQNADSTVVYPNPISVSTPLQIRWGKEFDKNNLSSTLYDISGKTWLYQQASTSQVISRLPLPSSLPAGIYFLKLNDNRRERVFKIIVSN
ncbi:MAG: S8 family peptidase [Runella sp.]